MNAPESPLLKLAIQALLENEALTSGLDDAAANTLLEWGMANLRQLHRPLLELPAHEIETAAAPGERANRRLLRAASRWAASRTVDDPAAQLAELAALAAELQGAAYTPPDPPPQAEFLQTHQQAEPAAFIARLQTLLTHPTF
jgi:hypothetical protein